MKLDPPAIVITRDMRSTRERTLLAEAEFDWSGEVAHPRAIQSDGSPYMLSAKNMNWFTKGMIVEACKGTTCKRFGDLSPGDLDVFFRAGKGIADWVSISPMMGALAWWKRDQTEAA